MSAATSTVVDFPVPWLAPGDTTLEADTIPATPVVGRRFARFSVPLWDVYDWATLDCPACLGLRGGEPGSPCCPECRGTGAGPVVPVLAAQGLGEGDARLLVYGPEMLVLCRAVLRTGGEAARARLRELLGEIAP